MKNIITPMAYWLIGFLASDVSGKEVNMMKIKVLNTIQAPETAPESARKRPKHPE